MSGKPDEAGIAQSLSGCDHSQDLRVWERRVAASMQEETKHSKEGQGHRVTGGNPEQKRQD